jgi:hypothetical protein
MMEQYVRQGLKPDSKVLDIRQVDVRNGRFLEDNTPVFVITFTTQEVLLFRDRKTGEVVVGAEDRVEQCNYAAVVTRVEEELENELTGGWKVIEVRLSFFARRARWVTGIYTDGSSVRTRVSMMTWPAALPLHTCRATGAVESLLKLHSSHIALCFVASTHHQFLAIVTTITPPPQPPLGKKICYTHILIRTMHIGQTLDLSATFCVFSTNKLVDDPHTFPQI